MSKYSVVSIITMLIGKVNRPMANSHENFFVQVKTSIVEDTSISASAYRLYCEIIGRCGRNKACWYSQAVLGGFIGVGARCVRKLVKELVKAGYLYVKRRGFKKVNEYVPLVRVEPSSDRTPVAQQDRNKKPGKLYSPNYNQSNRVSNSKSRKFLGKIPGYNWQNGEYVPIKG